MSLRRSASIVALAAAAALASACSSSGGGSSTSSTAAASTSVSSSVTTVRRAPPPKNATGAPAEVAAAAEAWPVPGQSYANTRTAARSTINASNVATLAKAWTSTTAFQNLSTAPLVLDGVVYLEDGMGKIVAYDARTGKERWVSDATGLNIGPYGVAAGDGQVYGLDGATGVIALDQKTGKTVWRTKITATETVGVDIQPQTFGGLVFAASVPVSIRGIYTPGDRGVIYALDARTGKIRWQFDTVQGNLWGHPEINSGGGAWYPPAIDTTRRIAYFGIANPAPFPGTKDYPNGSSRPGNNLYTDSLVALDVDTGKLLWFYQVTPHDLFDRDQVHAMIARANGRDVVISAGKSGVVVGLDPDTGQLLWKTVVGRHDNDDKPLQGKTVVYPGTYGGVETPPATADGVVYVATLNSPTTLKPDEVSYVGSDLGTAPGEVVAIDAATGKVQWSQKVPGDPLGGATVVNDLVLTATLQGQVIALARTDGRIVWTYDAGAGINGWMSAVGDSLYIPVGQAQAAKLVALRLPK